MRYKVVTLALIMLSLEIVLVLYDSAFTELELVCTGYQRVKGRIAENIGKYGGTPTKSWLRCH